ncbi:MAG TPA: FAD-dependent oxidoreductase [Clostridiaceae bacterium]|nr:FAD-dependent oxidoreductase [Clostridiaceae bacterium]
MTKNLNISSDEKQHYDLIVIGSGAGNIVVDGALQAGKTVALIEKGYWGGTCLNRGCIPTKILLTPADRLREWKLNKSIGLEGNAPSLNWPVVAERMKQMVLGNRSGVETYYGSNENCRLIHGTAEFTGEKALAVTLDDGSVVRLTADTIVIAAGGRSKVPPIEGLDEVGALTTERFFDDKFPEQLYDSVTLIGGADIGAEFAHMFASYGCKVNVVQHNVRLVPKQDEDVSAKVLAQFRADGINVVLNKDTTRVEIVDGKKRLHFKDRATGETAFVDSDELIISAGIAPYTDLLKPEKAGVELDRRGWVRTNEYLETTAPDIYAIGDINGQLQLRHKANYEAEILSWNLYTRHLMPGKRALRVARYDVVPSATFTHPQVGRVGMTEAQARAAGLDIYISKFAYSEVVKAYAMGIDSDTTEDGFVKLIVEKGSDHMLGMHIVGPEASILVQGAAWLMNAGKQPHAILNADIEHGLAASGRAGNYEDYIDPRTREGIAHAMTIHPALTEVVGWSHNPITGQIIQDNKV